MMLMTLIAQNISPGLTEYLSLTENAINAIRMVFLDLLLLLCIKKPVVLLHLIIIIVGYNNYRMRCLPFDLRHLVNPDVKSYYCELLLAIILPSKRTVPSLTPLADSMLLSTTEARMQC